MRIGIDFDNTIAAYDHVFLKAAKEWDLLPSEFAGNKTQIRDTIRQAVSLYRARSTGQWGYDAENDAPRQSVEFDRQAIQAALDQIHGHVDRWEAFLESTDIPVLRLTYEDLVANMDAEVRVLAMDMGYPVGPATPITTPTLRASDDLTDDLVRKFLGE